MCIYDWSKDEVKDKCQTIEKLEEQLAKGDEFIKCGDCYGDFNIYSRTSSTDCSDKVPCGEKDGEYEYPTCIWDDSKKKPKSECWTSSKLMDELNKHDDDILIDCKFCDEVNLFEGYGWEAPAAPTPPPKVGTCDWDLMDTCDDSGKKKESSYPMCIWDDSKGYTESICQKLSKLDKLKDGDFLAGCGYCN